MANVVDIILRGKNEASAAIKSVSGDLGGLKNSASIASSAFDNLITTAGLAAVGKAALEIGQVAVELGHLGAQALVTERSFGLAMSSVGASADLLDRLSTSAGGTITQMRLMQMANTAVAGASDELGQAFSNALPKLIEGARAANMLNPALGDTEFLFSSLVTGIKRGSPMLIDNTGITLKLGEANEKMAASLGKSTDALTEEEKKLAILNATMEGVDRLVQQVGGNLESTATSAQQLTTAWEELRTTIGKGLAPTVSASEKGLAEGINSFVEILQRGSGDASEQVKGLEKSLAGLRAERDKLAAGGNIFDPFSGRIVATSKDVEAYNRKIKELEVELVLLKTKSDNSAASTLGLAGAMLAAANAASTAAGAIATAYGVDATRSRALVDRFEGMTGATQAEQEARGWGWSQMRWQQEQIDKRTADEKEANEKIAKDYQNQMEAAGRAMAGRIEGYLSAAVSNASGLFKMPGTGEDFTKPGANGPFEDLYRALDVAKLGTASPWAEKLGLTQEEAKRISTDFQNGLFTPDVLKLIDMNALVDRAKLEEAAKKSQEIVANAVAARAGTNPVTVSTMLGFGGDKGSEKLQSSADAMMTQVAKGLQASITGQDVAGRIIGIGETVWGNFETGFVKKASQSNALKAAIVAFVEQALAAEFGD